MALTLLQQGQFAQTGEQLAVIQELASGDLLNVMPFRQISGNSIRFRREESLPDVGFRHINGSLTESYGETSIQSEAVHLFGGDLSIDKATLQLEGPEARAWNIQARVRAMRLAYEKTFIKGSEAGSNGLEFDGLQARIATTSSQYVANQSGNSGALSFGALDEALDSVDAVGGKKYILLSKAARRALTAGSRDGGINGGITIQADAMGRQRTLYGDTELLIIDRDHQNVEILGATEANSTTSLYVVTFGDTGLTGIQNGNLEVRELGEDTAKPRYVTRIEWYCGLAALSGRSIARLGKVDPSLAAIA